MKGVWEHKCLAGTRAHIPCLVPGRSGAVHAARTDEQIRVAVYEA